MQRMTVLMFSMMIMPFLCAYGAEDEPPTNFEVHTPTIINSVPGRTLIVFDWEPSTDPEGGLIQYRLLVWQGFYVVAQINNIMESHYSFDVDVEAPMWKEGVAFGFDVQAIDSAGNRVFGWQSTPYDGNVHKTDSPTVVPGYLWGYVYDSVSGDPVSDAVVFTKSNVTKSQNGTYGIQVKPGSVALSVTAPGYTDYTTILTVAENGVILHNIALRKENAQARAVLWGSVIDETAKMPVASATIYVDGMAHSVVNGSFMIQLSSGKHRVRCVAYGFAEIEGDVTLEDEEFRNAIIPLNATSEHIWLERDGVRLNVHLSGMQGVYDFYVVAVLPDGMLSLTRLPYEWQNGVIPLARSVQLFTAQYQLQILPEEAAEQTTSAILYACLVMPGKDPLNASNWNAYATLNWDKPGMAVDE